MTIIRDGRAYLLTEQELCDAYFEQQDNYDRQEIQSELDYIFADTDNVGFLYGVYIPERYARKLSDEMARVYRTYSDNSDEITDVLYELRQRAIREVAEKYEGDYL